MFPKNKRSLRAESRREVRLAEGLEPRCLLSASVVSLTSAINYIRLDSTGSTIQVFNSATPTGSPAMTFATTDVSSFIVSPTSGNDLLVVDYSNGDPVPVNGIAYTGSGGGNSLQVIGASPADAFTVTGGQVVHGTTSISFSNVLSLTMNTGNYTVPADLNLLNVTVNNQTSATFTSPEHIGQLTIQTGGTAMLGAFAGNVIVNGSLQFTPNGTASGTSKLNNLLLAGSMDNWIGRLDLTNNKLIVETAASNKASELAVLRNQVAFGATNATGVTSSLLSANTVVAVIDAANTGLTTFGGVPVDANSILIGPEIAGDVNLDGQVDLTDLSTVLNNMGLKTQQWTAGNFDGAATVDLTDLSDVLNNIGISMSNPATASATAASQAATSPLFKKAKQLVARNTQVNPGHSSSNQSSFSGRGRRHT